MKKAIPILLAAVLVLLCACMKHTPADVADGSLPEQGTDASAAAGQVNAYDPLSALTGYASNTLIAVTEGGQVLFDSTSDQTAQALSALNTWTDVARVVTTGRTVFGIRKDGGLYVLDLKKTFDYPASEWNNITSLAAFAYSDTAKGAVTAALKADGTVVCAGISSADSTDSETGKLTHKGFAPAEWTDIKAIAVAEGRLLGLKNDGTVIAAGTCREGEADVAGWRDIASVYAPDGLSLGVSADGALFAAGREALLPRLGGKTDVAEVVADAGSSAYILLKKDGTLGVARVEDGKEAALAGFSELENKTDVRQVVRAGERAAVLHGDGTVEITSPISLKNDDNRLAPAASWTNVLRLFGGPSYLAAITADGRVLVTEGVLAEKPFRFDTESWSLFSGEAYVPEETSAAPTTSAPAESTTAEPSALADATFTVDGYTLHYGRYLGDDGVSVCELNADWTYRLTFADGSVQSGAWRVRPADVDAESIALTDGSGEEKLYWPVGDDGFDTAFMATMTFRYAPDAGASAPTGTAPAADGGTFTVGGFTLHYGKYVSQDGVEAITLHADGSFLRDYDGANGNTGTWTNGVNSLGEPVLWMKADGEAGDPAEYLASDDGFSITYRFTTHYSYVAE